MLNLILFRHGKSDWDATYAADHDRPLAHRGREAAKNMGRLLSQIGQVPELAISSSAARARATLQLAARAGHWDAVMRVDEALYDSTADAVLGWLNQIDTNAESLLLTGHEPTWSELAGRLIGDAVIRIPTGAMLRIDFDNSGWDSIGRGDGELRWLLTPKMLARITAQG
jgi:phosphohistidine phosphatase